MEAYADYIETLKNYHLPEIPYRKDGNYREEPLLEYVVKVAENINTKNLITSTNATSSYPLIMMEINMRVINIFVERVLDGKIKWNNYFFAECMEKEPKGICHISDAVLFVYETYMRKLDLDKLLYLGLWLDDYIRDLKPVEFKDANVDDSMKRYMAFLLAHSESIDFNMIVKGENVKKKIKRYDKLYATLLDCLKDYYYIMEEEIGEKNSHQIDVVKEEVLDWNNIKCNPSTSFIIDLPNTKNIQMYPYREIMEKFIPSVDKNRQKEVHRLLPSHIIINRDKFKFAAELRYVLGIDMNLMLDSVKNLTNEFKYGDKAISFLPGDIYKMK